MDASDESRMVLRIKHKDGLPQSGNRPAVGSRSLLESATIERPLIRPGPPSAMVFPLVVIVAVLPGLIALNSWDLTPPAPLWGLRGLAVLDGYWVDQTPVAESIKPAQEKAAFQAIALRPPLGGWLIAMGFWSTADRDPLAAVLPSYIAGAAAVVLVHLHGRLWRGTGLGLAAAILVGFNQDLLLRIQEATPDTLGMCGASLALLCYGWHERSMAGTTGEAWWTSPTIWAMSGGLALGLTILAIGSAALLVVAVVVVHQYYLGACDPALKRGSRGRRVRFSLRDWPNLIDGSLALLVAGAVAAPWFLVMIRRHGWESAALGFMPHGLLDDEPRALASRLIELAPAALPLAIHGAVRAVREALVDESNSPATTGGSLWVVWFGLGSLALSGWSEGPRRVLELFVLTPLCLLAAQSIADLVNRRVPIRSLIILAPATAVTVAWWASANLNRAVADLANGHADAATVLGLHLGLDLVVASVVIIGLLNRLTRRRDRPQRAILAVFLITVLLITVGDGCREILFRHSETTELLSLRSMILRRDREAPFALLAVVSPTSTAARADSTIPPAQRPSLGGRLRYILKTALPRLPQRDLEALDELDALPDVERLVILVGAEHGLSSATLARLNLESIHPGRSGILDAYATTRLRRPRR